MITFQRSKQPWTTLQWVQHTENFLINETHYKNVQEIEKGKGDVVELCVTHRPFKQGSCAGCALDDHACANRGCRSLLTGSTSHFPVSIAYKLTNLPHLWVVSNQNTNLVTWSQTFIHEAVLGLKGSKNAFNQTKSAFFLIACHI